ncbi:MAG: 16S rRNA (uracil(1498)-N(3))-methyltransferase [Victivallales bacterium]|nr:16S rRNA (uracil(1498)-N(3))-methyltransferase [Victivallales bacterium]
MHRFFCADWRMGEEEAWLPPAESQHASRVLRLREGDVVGILNGMGEIATARLQSVQRSQVRCIVEESRAVPPPPVPVRLYVAPPKGKNMEALLKAATELGVARITPIACQYGVAKPDGDKSTWRQALVVACKQSGNPWLPQLDLPTPFAQALDRADEVPFLGAVPGSTGFAPLDTARLATCGAALWIGPEGGFSPGEHQALQQAGATALCIGQWILRVETAVPALLGRLDGLLAEQLPTIIPNTHT